MITRTLFFENPGHISVAQSQLVFEKRDGAGATSAARAPMEDIGIVVIENTQITISAYAVQALAENNTVVVFCDLTHTPNSMLLPLAGNTLAQKHFQAQASASEALKQRLWRQTIKTKIENQARCLEIGGKNGAKQIRSFLAKIKVGENGGAEALAAKDYFHFHTTSRMREQFRRDPEGPPPNDALNYGYAIVRAAMARSLVGSGLSCMFGIQHSNQYNAFVLADDVMEPYRPFVDDVVFNAKIVADAPLTKETKTALLNVLTADVMVGDGSGRFRRPLMNAMTMTSASLVRCFHKEQNEMEYPTFAKSQKP